MLYKSYGKLGESEVFTTAGDPPEGYIEVFENKTRPSPEHVLNADGLWIVNNSLTNEQVDRKRELRYKAETDELMIKIASHKLLGKDVTSMEEEAKAKLIKIREDLPYVNTTTHYEPVREPTVEAGDGVDKNAGEVVPE
jgi:hypothetical protein